MVVNQTVQALDFGAAFDPAGELAALFKALAEPLRLEIVRLMRGDSFSVSELCQVFDLRQSALSHHLKVLVNANWLTRRREGTAIYYRRQLPQGVYRPLREQIIDALDAQPLAVDFQRKLAAVQSSREQNSQAFFRDNAERFREHQELIASWDDYSACTLQLLDAVALGTDATLLEIGPGDGRLLPKLTARCANVIGLDNSPAMLETARAAVSDTDNVTLMLGDTAVALSEGVVADAIIMNMVLHHTADPKGMLAEAGQLLKRGGALVISELCAHDQGWAREHCGDLWLGFDPEQLTGWAASAGLMPRASQFIAQRNGFQVQVQLFQRADDHKGSSL